MASVRMDWLNPACQKMDTQRSEQMHQIYSDLKRKIIESLEKQKFPGIHLILHAMGILIRLYLWKEALGMHKT